MPLNTPLVDRYDGFIGCDDGPPVLLRELEEFCGDPDPLRQLDILVARRQQVDDQQTLSYPDLFFLASVTPRATPTAMATHVAAIRTNRNHALRIPHILLSTGGWVLPGASST